MKQGTNNIMKVHFNYNFELIESIDFIFQQDDTRLLFTYPSENARKVEDEDAIYLTWTDHDTYKFNVGDKILMDTKIHLVGSDTNPATEVVSFIMDATLFEEEIE